jgi:hypothetical protein
VIPILEEAAGRIPLLSVHSDSKSYSSIDKK